MMFRISSGLVAVTLCLLSSSLNAATVVLEQGVNGYAGTADTTLFQDASNNSAGGFPDLFAGVTKTGSLRRTLLKFDLPTTLTASAVITSVSLRVNVDQARPGTFTHTLHKVTRTWNEGSLPLTDPGTIGLGAPAQPGDATWNSAADVVTSWTTPGGDYVATASGSAPVDIAGTSSVFTGTGMVQDVQAWLATPVSNSGWLMRGDETVVWNAKRFVSSEGIAGQRPQLTITYTPPVPTAAEDWAIFE